MSGGFVLISIFEFAVATFIIYGLFNEEKFAECERVLAQKVRQKFN